MTLAILLFWLLAAQPATPPPPMIDCGGERGVAPAFSLPAEAEDPFERLLVTQVAPYLDAVGSAEGLASALEALGTGSSTTVTVQTLSADFTADGADDIFVMVDVQNGSFTRSLLSLYTCAVGAHIHLDTVPFVTGSPISMAVRPPELVMAYDLNANGRLDVLLVKPTIEGQKVHGTLAIYEWDGSTLAQTFRLGPSYGGYGDVYLMNRDDDLTTLEFNVGYFFAYEEAVALAFIEYNITRPIEIIYRWTGAAYERHCRIFDDVPQLRIFILHSAEALRACGLYDEAEAYYTRLELGIGEQEAWSDRYRPQIIYPEGLTQDEQRLHAALLEIDYLRAFAEFRLLQLELRRNPEAASQPGADLTERYPPGSFGHAYAAMAQALAETFAETGDMGAACTAAEQAFAAARLSGDDPGVTYDSAGFQSFYATSGFIYSPEPDHLFNVPEALQGMLQIPICLEGD